MTSWMTLATWFPFRHLIPATTLEKIALGSCRRLSQDLCGTATDGFLDLLLASMELFVRICPSYRAHVQGVRARYVFRTADNSVKSGITLDGTKMKLNPKGIDNWDVRVSFKDVPALKSFLFSRDQDILTSLLRNDVEIDGNLNYVYKFGFMARDLGARLGIK